MEHYILNHIAPIYRRDILQLQCYNQESALSILTTALTKSDIAFITSQIGADISHEITSSSAIFKIANRSFAANIITKHPLGYIANYGTMPHTDTTSLVVFDIKNPQDKSFRLYQISAPFTSQSLSHILAELSQYVDDNTHFIMYNTRLINKDTTIFAHEIDPALKNISWCRDHSIVPNSLIPDS